MQNNPGRPDKVDAPIEASRLVRENLLRTNAILSTQLETSPDGILVVDESGTILSANRRFYELWQIPREYESSRSDEELLSSVLARLADPQEFLDRVNYLYEHREEQSWEEVELKNNIFFERYSSPMYGADGNYYGRIWYFRDISDRKKYELALQNNEDILRSTINSISSVLVGIDRQGRVTQWNDRAVEMTGLPANKALNQPVTCVLPVMNEWQVLINRALDSGVSTGEKKVAWHYHDYSGFLDISVFPLVAGEAGGSVIRIDDITERVRTAEMIQQTEKMLSIAGLAAGMAHEITNPLGGILQGVQNIQRRFSPDLASNKIAAEKNGIDLVSLRSYMEERNILSMLESIRIGGTRASRIVHNMLQFSRSSASQLEPADLDQLVEKAVDLASNDYDLHNNYDFRRIVLTREYGLQHVQIRCVETEIEQVFLNLLKNAAQAMMSGDSPVENPQICISTGLEEQMAVIRIRDNGPGIAPDIIKRIFEPFFSTKSTGQGTGLGLSVSHFIITEKHHGSIHAESSAGQGTSFTIRLPAGA